MADAYGEFFRTGTFPAQYTNDDGEARDMFFNLKELREQFHQANPGSGFFWNIIGRVPFSDDVVLAEPDEWSSAMMGDTFKNKCEAFMPHVRDYFPELE